MVLCVNESTVRDRARERLYVGMSRATDELVVVGTRRRSARSVATRSPGRLGLQIACRDYRAATAFLTRKIGRISAASNAASHTMMVAMIQVVVPLMDSLGRRRTR